MREGWPTSTSWPRVPNKCTLQEWEAAADVFQRLSTLELDVCHPLSAHGRVREAHCYLRLGKLELCRVRLDSLELGRLNVLADLVITIAAEIARYHAVDRACHYWQGQDSLSEADDRSAQLMRLVGAIVPAAGEDSRTHYLRRLFYAVLTRDVGSLMPPMN